MNLHSAVYNGDITVVRALIVSGVDPDTRDNGGHTALFWCCLRGMVGDQLSVANILLDAGANPDLQPAGVDTPLTAAILSGNTELVNLLIARGASPNHLTSQGVSPLMAAAREGNLDMVSILLSNGASVDLTCDGFKASDYALQYGHENIAAMIEAFITC